MNSPDSAAGPQLDETALERLGRMYRLSSVRYLFLLLIPALWVFGVLIASIGRIDGLVAGFLIAWFFIVLFGVAAWVFLVIPEKEELKRKYVSHVLPFLFSRNGLNVDYYPSHDLSMATFLKSGLFHDDYNTMLREDCLQGSAARMQFSMYQVAVQIATRSYGRYGSSARTATNQFYGWAIHAIIPRIAGTHVILPRRRKTGDESDDWLEKTGRSWTTNPKCAPLLTGYAPFDQLFILYTDNQQVFFSFATKEFLDFLIYLYNTTKNAFGINASGNVFALHMGHDDPTFRHMPNGNFVTEFDPELLEEVKWFSDMIKGIQKFTSRAH
jgi:hypothetical protein